MSNAEFALRLWPIVVGVILVIVWFIRLESNLNNMREKFKELKSEMEKDLEEIKDTAKADREAVKEIAKEIKENEKDIWKKIEVIKEQNSEILRLISRLEGKLEPRKGDQRL